MSALKAPPQVQDIVEEIDRLIDEMASLRNHVSALSNPPVQTGRSVREAEYFGMQNLERASDNARHCEMIPELAVDCPY